MSAGGGMNLFEQALDSWVDFSVDHPVISTVVRLSVLIAGTMGFDWLNDRRNQRHNARVFDPNSAEEKQKKEFEELKKKLEAKKKSNILLYCKETLEWLEKQPRLNQVQDRFAARIDALKTSQKNMEQSSDKTSGQYAERLARLQSSVEEAKEDYLTFDKRWQAARSEWETRWDQVDDLAAQGQNFSIPVNTTEGQEMAVIDGEFWSRGELLRARQTLPQKEQPQDATIEDFMSLSNEADRLYQRIEQMIRQAGTDYLSSQVCIQISSSVYESLQERGWYLREETDYAFTGGDEREPLSLKMYSPAEDQVEFVFRLDGELTMRPEFSGVHNRGVMEQLAGVLQTALEASGAEVQSVTL